MSGTPSWSDHEAYGSGGSHEGYDYTIGPLPSSSDGGSGTGLNPIPGQFNYSPELAQNAGLGRSSQEHVPEFSSKDIVYSSYAGVDIVALIVLPNESAIELGELQTFSYSIHRENHPVRLLGHTSPAGFVKGIRTIAGSMIFTVFNFYAFYRLKQFQAAINKRLYPVADMLPPIDMVLTFANETGVFSKMKLLGLTFIDEGGTMSVDDLVTEQTFSYMARGIQPMTGYYVPRR